MIAVTVEAWPLVSEIFGGDKIHRYMLKMEVAQNSTLGDLVEKLSDQRPALKRVIEKSQDNELTGFSNISVVINGRLANSASDFKAKLKKGDRIVLVQGFAGG